MRDRAAGGVDGQAVGGGHRGVRPDVAVEGDGPAPGGQRPGHRRRVGRVVKEDVAGVVDRVGGEQPAELQPELVRRAADVGAELDRRRIQPQDGVASAGVGECVDEIDVTVGLQVDVGRGQRAVQRRRTDLRLARRRQAAEGGRAARDDLQDVRVEQPGPCRAIGGEGGDDRPVGDPDVGRGGLDEAAVSAMRRADVELAGGGQSTDGHVREQAYAALFARDQGLRLDDAVMVDGRARELGGRLRGEQHVSARGDDGAAVGDERIQGALFDLKTDDASEIELHLAAGGQEDAALRGLETACVRDLGGDHRDHPALAVAACRDVTFVDDRIPARAGERKLAGHEIGIGHVQGRCDQAAYVNLGGRREEDAVGVEQENAPVGRERALDHGRIRSRHPVEGDRRRGRLDETDGTPLPHGEIIPLECDPIRRLADRHHRTCRRDGRLSRHQLGTGRKAICLGP